jgi:hypothetical protein
MSSPSSPSSILSSIPPTIVEVCKRLKITPFYSIAHISEDGSTNVVALIDMLDILDAELMSIEDIDERNVIITLMKKLHGLF